MYTSGPYEDLVGPLCSVIADLSLVVSLSQNSILKERIRSHFEGDRRLLQTILLSCIRFALVPRSLDPVPLNSRVNGGIPERLPNTTNISFESIEGESILLLMDEFSICASSGSACTSGSLQPSHVLRAMGVPFTMAHGSVRFSLSVYNTEEEIDFVIDKIPPIIEKLRELSPFWKPEGQAC